MSEVDKLYSRLFTVGSLRRNAAWYSVVVAGTALAYLVAGYVPLLAALALFAASPPLEYASLLPLRASRRFYCARRLLALNILSASASLTALAAVSPLGEEAALYALAAVYLWFKSFVYGGTVFEGLVHSLLPTAANCCVAFSVVAWQGGAYTASLSAICVPAVFAQLAAVERSARLGGFGAVSYAKGCVMSICLDDPRMIEGMLSSISSRRRIPVYVISILRGSRVVGRILVPYLHFGPFRNVGSAAFTRAAKSFGRSVVMVLRGPATHDLDLATHEDVSEVVNVLEGAPGTRLEGISRLISVTRGRAEARGFRMGRVAFVILSYDQMEDLPPSVSTRVEDLARSLGFEHAVVVDAHNSLDTHGRGRDGEAVEDVIDAARELLELLSREPTYPPEAEICEIRLDGFGLEDGLGSGHVTALVWRAGGCNVLLSFDTNNMSSSYRRALEAEISSRLGCRVAVATTDTHEVTARGLVEGGYVIWGVDEKSWRSIPVVAEGVRDAILHAAPCVIALRREDVEVRVLGDNLVERASSLIRRSMRLMKALTVLPASALLAGLLALLIL
ncbi:hypothetical protein B6U99_02130 [Candidatus Geothermarchaeota archaeon ex4572_27]|nr:MAG: hypothetical protein B6U99_02130 [Candidatus Geothermarchaeota archaeon ex4572_27]